MFILVFITFGSFVVCFDVSLLIKQVVRAWKKIHLLEILKSKPEVIGLFYPTIQYPDFSHYLLPELSAFLNLCSVANT